MAPHSPDAGRRLAGSDDDWSLIDEQLGAIARVCRMTGGPQDGQWFWAALTVFSDTPTRLDNMESSQNLGRRNLAHGASAARRLGKAEHTCPMVQRSGGFALALFLLPQLGGDTIKGVGGRWTRAEAYLVEGSIPPSNLLQS